MMMMTMIWRRGGCIGGGGIPPVLTPAPCCQHRNRTVDRDPFSVASWWPSAGTTAAWWRLTFPASRCLISPSSAWSRNLGTDGHSLSLSHTHWHPFPACTLSRNLFCSVIPSVEFWNLRDFTFAETQTVRTDCDRCGEYSGGLRVRLLGAQRFCRSSRERNTSLVPHPHFNPRLWPENGKMILHGAALLLLVSGRFCDLFLSRNLKRGASNIPGFVHTSCAMSEENLKYSLRTDRSYVSFMLLRYCQF